MKRGFFIFILLIAVSVGWYNNRGPGSAVVDRVVEGFLAPYRIVALSARAPDEELLMPVKGATVRNVANTWHAPRSGNRKHQGQDIFARRGTPVQSATDGIVMRVGENQLGGNTVSVLGAGRRLYYYAHLDRYAEGIQVGDKIKRGAILGYVGTTGNARTTPPHLHFGVYSPTGALDPLPLLRAGAQPRPAEAAEGD
jgi:peptidoglycan LD-endopeptidase LytH